LKSRGMLSQLSPSFILVNWGTHQVLTGCKDNKTSGKFVCSNTEEKAQIE